MIAIGQEPFEACVEKYGRLVFTICFSFTRNYFDAEDLAQEAFLSAYKNWGAFDGLNAKAWLTTIAANKCRDYLKSPARKTSFLSEEDAALLEDRENTPANLTELGETSQRVRTLCERLREPYRSVATGYFCQDKKLSEMARDTGQSLKTLQTRLYRAKKLLRELWKEDAACGNFSRTAI